ncbi:MAG: DUF4249 domain-containing protein [Saprospiraceae bacterium]|nr:DUF4249 domain-containing protein [Lewinella sp.]
MMNQLNENNATKPLMILVLGMIIGLSACLSEITLDVPRNDKKQLVIRGVLKDGDTTGVTVSLSYLTDFVPSETPDYVVDATVTLMDESGNQVSIPMQQEGLYQLAIPYGAYELEVTPGRSYQLSVVLSDGKRYESTLETLYDVPAPQSVYYLTEQRIIENNAGNLVDQEYLKFLINTPLLNARGERSFLKWSFIGTYKFMESSVDSPFPPNVHTCYISEALDLEHVVAYNGEENSQDQLSNYFLLEEPFDYRFVDGFYLSIYQQSLSENAYNYWSSIGKVVDLSGNFFEAPPGKVRGNFKNVEDDTEEVYGYFYATQETIFRYHIPSARDRVEPYCPVIGDPDTAPGICFNCLSRPGSSLEKPDFWED